VKQVGFKPGVKDRGSRKWSNRYQIEVDEETEGVDSRDKVKSRSDQLFLERIMTVTEQE